MRRVVLLLMLSLLPTVALAQGNTVTTHGTGAPTAGCVFIRFYVDDSTGDLYNCKLGVWNLVGGSAAPLTGPSFTAGSVPFATAATTLGQDNANFFWNASAPVGLFVGPRTGFGSLAYGITSAVHAASSLNTALLYNLSSLMVTNDITGGSKIVVLGTVQTTHTSGTLANSTSGEFDNYHNGAGGTVTNQNGVSGFVENDAGTVVTASGGIFATGIAGTGVTTNNIGVQIVAATDTSSGAITNNYGLKIGNQTVGSTINSAITTGTGTIDLGGKITTYNAVATVENGVPSSKWIYTSTGNVANIASTAFTPAITSAVAGRYRLTCYVAVTTQATTSSTVPQCNLLCTDPTDSVAKTIQVTPAIAGVAVNPTTAVAESGAGMCDAKVATGITISTTGYLSVGATAMAYKVYAILEAM